MADSKDSKGTKDSKGAKTGGGSSDVELAAMKERAAELRAEGAGGSGTAKEEAGGHSLRGRAREARGDGPRDREPTPRDRRGGGAAPGPEDLGTGLPSYARDGKVVVFFTPASKFGERYASIGFNEDALLDDGIFWPTSFAVLGIDDEVEARLRELVRRAAG